MKYLSPCLFLLISFIACDRIEGWSDLRGPYLGQTPPGKKAEMFASGLLSSGGSSELNISFSPDGTELCYSLISGGEAIHLLEPRGPFLHRFLMYSHLQNEHWKEPVEFPYLPKHGQWYPNFSPDGKRIYFNSKSDNVDPLDSSSPYIWYVEKSNGKWTSPVEIDFGENYTGWTGVKPSVASNGNLYFALFPDRQNGSIYMSKYENGNYSSPEILSESINDQGANHPYIAPDESFILFDYGRSENNYGESDIYISFRDNEGRWTKAQNLGTTVNTKFDERRPFLSFDGKYLFFTSARINQEMTDDPKTLNEIKRLTNSFENGYQHIYWISAEIINELKSSQFPGDIQ